MRQSPQRVPLPRSITPAASAGLGRSFVAWYPALHPTHTTLNTPYGTSAFRLLAGATGSTSLIGATADAQAAAAADEMQQRAEVLKRVRPPPSVSVAASPSLEH